jgi:hypothetical protein
MSPQTNVDFWRIVAAEWAKYIWRLSSTASFHRTISRVWCFFFFSRLVPESWNQSLVAFPVLDGHTSVDDTSEYLCKQSAPISFYYPILDPVSRCVFCKSDVSGAEANQLDSRRVVMMPRTRVNFFWRRTRVTIRGPVAMTMWEPSSPSCHNLLRNDRCLCTPCSRCPGSRTRLRPSVS